MMPTNMTMILAILAKHNRDRLPLEYPHVRFMGVVCLNCEACTHIVERTIVIKFWNTVVAKSVKLLHSEGLTRNEVINCGGYRYPIAEFLGFSDQKISDILRSAGASPSNIAAAFVGINEMRKK